MQEGRGRGAARGSGRGGREGRKQQHMSSTTSSSDISIKNGTGNRRRQNQRSGRGSGRHSNTRDVAPNQQTNHHKPINIETTNFQSIFHNKLCRAAKYKVHAPHCSCPKVVKLRQRYESTQIRVKPDNETVAKTSGNIGGYSNYDQIQFDIDGNITHQLSQLDITTNNINDDNNHPFDNLIVLFDTKGTSPSIYSCTNTNLLKFQKDGISCEQKLSTEIFGSTTTTTTDKVHSTNNKKIPPFKVNCAICLLTTHQRNGFVAITSNSFDELQSTITSARKSTLVKQSNGEKLHADHAHFICAIKLSSLYSLLSAGKTRSKNEMVMKDVLMQIRNDKGVDCLSPEMINESSSIQIKMGHHLTSLLWLLQDDKQKSSNNNVKYIMVMGYIDSPHAIELDLPGGKRHLGEATIQGVIREVEEECSLQIDYDWLVGHVSKRYGGKDTGEGDGSIQVLEPRKVKGSVSGDAFFVMSPPPDIN